MSLYLLNYKLCSTTEEKFDYANFKAPLSNIFLKKSSLNQMALCDVKGLQVLLIPLRINTQSAPLCSFLLGFLVCWCVCLSDGHHTVCYRSLYFFSRWQNKPGLKCEQTVGLPSTGDKKRGLPKKMPMLLCFYCICK